MTTTSGASADRGMAGAVARGSFWMVLNAGAQRSASFVAQVVLGWLLSDNDFGLYALAIAVSTVGLALRDGGARQLLIQRHGEYGTLVGPVFWMAASFNTAIGLLLSAAAPAAAWAYGEPALTGLILVIAAALPLGTPGSILSAKLSIDLRFREAARIMTVSSLVRYLGAIGLAWAGLGPMSFVLPLPLMAVIEWVMAYAYTHERPWRGPRAASTWPGLWRSTRWLVAGSLAVTLFNLGASMAIKPFLSTAVVGLYFFAYQIVVQIGMLISANVTQVFFPAFARMGSDDARLSKAAARALRALMLIGSPMCLGLAATFEPLEQLIWGGKWAGAADAVKVTGLLYPAMIATAVPFSVQQALGRFRASGLSLGVIALASLAASAGGAAMWESATGVAIATSAVSAVFAIGYVVATMHRHGVGLAEIVRSLFAAWTVSLGAAAACVGIDGVLAGDVHPGVRVMIGGAVFCIIFGLVIRVLLPNHLREALAVVPGRMAAPVVRLLRLSGPARSGACE